MTILAFDQASKVSGYSVYHDQQLFAHGTFTLTGDLGDRLVKMRNKIQSLVDEYKPDKIILEDIQLQEDTEGNVKTYKTLAEVFGVAHELITELKIPYEAILASSWKSGLAIKGKVREEQKRNAQKWVTNTYSLKVSQDESDAICIGAYAAGIRVNDDVNKDYDWSD